MSNLTLVLWLQSGRQFQLTAVPDLGCAPREYRLVVPRYACLTVGPADYPPLDRQLCEDLAFTLTVSPGDAAAEYAIGRRRFHYREASGWLSPEERYERDRRDRREAIYRRVERAVSQHQALLDVGAFPVHGCALPAGWGLEQLLGIDASRAPWAVQATYSPGSAPQLALEKLAAIAEQLMKGKPLG